MTIQKTDISAFWEGLNPPDDMGLWEWSNTFRYLSTKNSSSPGRFNGEKTPYMKAVYDALSPQSGYERIFFIKSTQVGGSEAAYNLVGYHMHKDPCPILYVLPSKEICKEHSSSRFDPMVEDTPELRNLLPQRQQREGKNTMLVKEFPGGIFYYVGANNPDDLRSKPVRLVVFDEVTVFKHDIKGEGSPIGLAEKRTNTFSNKKIFMLSTPTVEGQCIISREYEKTDQRRFQVPCPHCGVPQFLIFENLEWDPTDYSSVRYVCAHCSERISERFKPKMLAHGEWVATEPKRISKKRIGFHINALYSPLGWLSWADLAEEYDKAKGDESLLKTFTNTNLGLAWKEQGSDQPDWQRLHERVDNQNHYVGRPSEEVFFITAGVDIQGDRIEMVVRGWGREKRNWTLDYVVLEGDTAKPDVWGLLGKKIAEVYTRPDGVQLPIRMVCVDSGFNTSYVYSFCQNQDPNRVIPIKGQDKLGVSIASPRQVQVSSSGKKVGKVRVYSVGSSFLKGELYNWLKLERNEDGTVPANYCHFPQMDQHFFKSLTAEKIKIRLVKGYPVYEWVKEYRANEVLDCMVYARAGAALLGIDRMSERDWDQMAENLKPKQVKTAEPAKNKSTFWEGGKQDKMW